MTRLRFIIIFPSSFRHFLQEEDAKKNLQPKGGIQISEILKNGKGVAIVKDVEIHLKLRDRTYELKANTAEEAQRWAKTINVCIDSLSNESRL